MTKKYWLKSPEREGVVMTETATYGVIARGMSFVPFDPPHFTDSPHVNRMSWGISRFQIT
jgi:hypothetical protein